MALVRCNHANPLREALGAVYISVVAHRYLRTALALASPTGSWPPSSNKHPASQPCSVLMPTGTSLKPYVDELSVGAEAFAASSKSQTGLLPGGLLSDRELTVLRLSELLRTPAVETSLGVE